MNIFVNNCITDVLFVLTFFFLEFLLLPHNQVKLMVLILEGSSQHAAHAYRKIGLFEEKKTMYDCSRSNLIPCAPISEIPSNINPMAEILKPINQVWS